MEFVAKRFKNFLFHDLLNLCSHTVTCRLLLISVQSVKNMKKRFHISEKTSSRSINAVTLSRYILLVKMK